MKLIFLIGFTTILTICQGAMVTDTVFYPREGRFDYALIKDAEFYVPIRPSNPTRANVIRKTNLRQKSIPIRHSASGIGDPGIAFNWHLCGNTLFSYDMFQQTHSNARIGLQINIVYRDFETRDSIVVRKGPPQWIKDNMVTFMPLASFFHSYIFKGMGTDLIVRNIDKYYDYLNFDVYFNITDSLLNVFMRDKDVFYIWEALLPDIQEFHADWQLQKAYASTHYDHEFIPRTENNLYDSKKTTHNAITDTLFFDGHFKVIEQDNKKYIVNRQYGIIYHMGDRKITPIGRVMVTDDYPKIQGKPLFIEDRDQNRIIFFAPIEWYDTRLPKPLVYYMKEEEMREYFKYVMD